MKLFNTLTRSIEEVTPLQPNALTIYTCGPTVYDYPHIGNWFTFIRYDLLVRTAKLSGLTPTWVMNITDVGHLVSDADEGEDKLEKGAKREGKTAWDVAEYYGNYFQEGLRRLNITPPDFMPKATEHIAEQITLIEALHDKDYAYIINDGIYYDTSKFEGYAAFARLDLDDQQAGARVEYNTQKRNASDFALWKFSPESTQRDMEWESPLGIDKKGFPGWHLECSAMAMKYLGETIDIHSGGIDHIPVHHTNEIAQSEAVTGKRFANYWMHANHITVNDEKISKSLGNSITLEDIEEKGISLDAFRLHVLESHYRSQSKFSWQSLEAAQNRLRNWQAVADLRWQAVVHAPGEELSQHEKTVESLQGGIRTFVAGLGTDLDTPNALRQIDEIFNKVADTLVSKTSSQVLISFIDKIDQALGTKLLQSKDITPEQYQTITERQKARDDKDWAKSDELRDVLLEQGIELRDTPKGAIWRRIS